MFQDFFAYKKGIYEPRTSQRTGWHAVRLIGWGTGPDESGRLRNYWLAANSWGTVCFFCNMQFVILYFLNKLIWGGKAKDRF